MFRKLLVLAGTAALVAGTAVGALLVSAADEPPTRTVMFGLVGDPADPPAGAGGATRDRNEPGAIVVKRGTTVLFNNRSGGMHQVAVYDKGLNYDQPGCGGPTTPCANVTSLADLTLPPTVPSWGNFIVPPDGSLAKDDPATPFNETRLGAGQIALGPSPLGVAVPARQAGAIDFSYTFTDVGQYMVICNFAPHMANYAQSTFVLVTD